MDNRYMKPWQVIALALLGVGGFVLGAMLVGERINPIAGMLLCTALPFFGAMVTAAK